MPRDLHANLKVWRKVGVPFLRGSLLGGFCSIWAIEGDALLWEMPFSGVPKWVVVKIMVTFWIPTIIRHLIFGVP